MPFDDAIEHLTKQANDLLRDGTPLGRVPDDETQQKLRSLNNAITFLKVANLGGMSALISLVRQWGTDRKIIGPEAKATPLTQFEKLKEEMNELAEGLENNDQHEVIDAIGDCTVVLILLADLVGVRFESCLVAAYDEIKGRTGTMVNGVYIKDR